MGSTAGDAGSLPRDGDEKERPAEAAAFKRRTGGELPQDFRARVEALVKEADAKAETMATRKASQNALEALAIRATAQSAGRGLANLNHPLLFCQIGVES